MKRIVWLLIILTFSMSASAQDFDIWDFIAHPRVINYQGTYPYTREDWVVNAQKHLPMLTLRMLG